MDKTTKFLKRLSRQERDNVREAIRRVLSGSTENLDIKKLKGYVNIFRVRVGENRVVFSNEGGNPRIVFVDRKSDMTYKNL